MVTDSQLDTFRAAALDAIGDTEYGADAVIVSNPADALPNIVGLPITVTVFGYSENVRQYADTVKSLAEQYSRTFEYPIVVYPHAWDAETDIEGEQTLFSRMVSSLKQIMNSHRVKREEATKALQGDSSVEVMAPPHILENVPKEFTVITPASLAAIQPETAPTDAAPPTTDGQNE